MIKEFKGQYRFLSNFYPLEYPIRFNGFEFWTSEHLYVALKVTQDAGLQQIIASFETPGKAKKYGRNLNIRHDWEEIKFRCMRFALTQKFATNHELETAREIQSFILPQEMPRQQSLEIAARYVPMAAVAGDFYDFIVIDEKRLGILVADVSGHGVPASLIASMVKIAFVSQTSHASDPARVLAGVNRILCGKLESDFVTAGYLYIDTGQQTASYAGAGHPPLLLWRQAEQKIFEFRTKGLVLGQFDQAQHEAVALSYDRGDRFFLYSDGIVEASNMADELFGWERFKACIVANSGLPANKFADKLIEDLTHWSAKGSTATLDDDLTLVVVDVAGGA